MRVLLGQLGNAADAAANVAAMADAVRHAPAADLAVFPELAVDGYDLRRAPGTAVAAQDPVFDPLREAARDHGTAVITGFAERADDGLFNAAACIDTDGAWAATYRKLQLFGPERDVFTPGDELLVVELGGVRVAPLICFDVEFCEHARTACAAGAELLVTIAANMAPYAPDHRLAAVARALDNRRPHVYVNHAGHAGRLRLVGESAVVTGDGECILRLGREPTTALCDVPRAEPDADVDYLQLLRRVADVRLETTRPKRIASS